MAKAKHGFKAKMKKSLAVISSLAIILSCGTTGLFTANAAETDSIVASEATSDASKIYIYDENGKDITANPIVYLDNTPAAKGNFTSTFTAKVMNDKGELVDTNFSAALEAQPKNKPHVRKISDERSKGTCKVTLRALDYDKQGKVVPLEPGTTHLTFAADNGNLYRTVTVVVYGPATDSYIYWGNKDTLLALNDCSFYGSTAEFNYIGVQAIANHQYPIYYEFTPDNSTDIMEYSVYDGTYIGEGTPKSTDKAEISQDGIFTPKKNGIVTIVAKAKATQTSDRSYSEGKKKVFRKQIVKGIEVEVESTEVLQTMPKYIIVTIVKDNPAKALNITNPISALQAGETHQFEIDAEPTYSKEQGYETGATDVFRWESSNPEIATVDQKGYVTAISKGDTKITVYAENDTVYSECDIRVLTKATSIKLPKTSSTRVGVTSQITATMSPETADEEIEWFSSDPTIATVEAVPVTQFTNTQVANITGVKKGTVIITARAKNSGVEAKCTINITDKIATDNLSFSRNDSGTIYPVPADTAVEVFTTQSITVNVKLTNSDGQQSDDKVNWTISGNDQNKYAVVTTSLQGVTIKGVAAGRIKITATSDANSKITKSFYVDVLKSSEIITIINKKNGETISSKKSLQINNTLPLSAVLTISGNYPNNHNDRIKSWSSANTKVATVDSNGNVRGVSNGTASISVTTASGLKKTIDVTVFSTSSVNISNNVKPAANASSLPTASLTLNKLLTGTLTFTVTVKNQDNKIVSDADVVWSSTNEDVATINNKGVVTAHDVGTTILTVKSGPQEQSCLLTVIAPMDTTGYTKINDTTVFADAIEPEIYTPGKEVYEPHPTVSVGNNNLRENVDYTLSYVDNTKPGSKNTKVVITGMNNFVGSINVPFSILPRPLTDSSVTIEAIAPQECLGSNVSITPDPVIKCDGITLENTKDYTLSYKNNRLPGTATVTIKGAGNYTGTITAEFEIYCEHKTLKNVKVLQPATYDNEGLEEGVCTVCGAKIQRVTPKIGHSSNPAKSLSFENSEIGMVKGDKTTLTPIGVGRNNASKPITDRLVWQSNNKSIVTVDDNGTLTALKKGTAVITVYGEYENVTAHCTVTVIEKGITQLEITPNPAATRVSVSTELHALVNPDNTDDELIWEIENQNIAEITSTNNQSIIVVGKAVGSTKVTVRGKYSNVVAETTLKVTNRNASDLISIKANIYNNQVTLPTGSGTYSQKIFSNQDITFTANLKDANGNKSDDTVIWTITNNENDYVTIPNKNAGEPQEGDSITIHGTSLGTATLTASAKTKPNVKAVINLDVVKSCNNVVIQNSDGVKISSKPLNVRDGVQLEALLTTDNPANPFDHSDSIESWTSSDPTIASVSPTGYVTALKNDTAVITVTTASHKTAKATIKVFTTSNIYFTSGYDKNSNPPTLTLTLENNKVVSKKLVATVYDQNEKAVSGATCIWESSDDEIATVSDDGTVTANSIGTAVITARSGAKETIPPCLAVVVAPIKNAVCGSIPDQVYSPEITEYEPELPRITVNDVELFEGIDFTCEYSNNTAVGTGKIKLTGIGDYTGTKELTFKIVKKNLGDPDIEISDIEDQEYTSQKITPAFTVSYMGVELVEGTDYTVAYTNNTNVSTDENPAFVKITGKGNYTGTANKSFKIVKIVKGMYGDVTGDGSIKSNDALSILRASVGIEKYDEFMTKLADVDSDNKITSADSLFVLRCSVGLVDKKSKAGQDMN